jgi:hypothetical protein
MPYSAATGVGIPKTSMMGYIFKNLDLFSRIIDIIYRKIYHTMPAYYVAIGLIKEGFFEDIIA